MEACTIGENGRDIGESAGSSLIKSGLNHPIRGTRILHPSGRVSRERAWFGTLTIPSAFACTRGFPDGGGYSQQGSEVLFL